jgi:hypothetical protein
MGVLEDAIREHLELKRQHGASEEEVERQETEVLGQARRQAAEPEESAQAAGEELPAGEEPAGAEPFDEAPADLAEAPEAPFEEAAGGAAAGEPDTEESEAPLGAEPRSVGEIFAADPASDLDTDDPATPGAVSEPAAPAEEPFDHAIDDDEQPPQAFADDSPGGETVTLQDFVEFDELEPGSAPPMPAHGGEEPAQWPEGDDPESEDVLEETPEFLQETPEHDRLWFEQKPPRDFDFD